ncbi:MAG: HD domain-containing protein [Acidobacteriota bacterium]|nr:HD domain-containing protein [Acidobacteriota bacterium]MDH3522956.1 HD domain-containing protein [Acidobacteriota bacterium]
MPSRPHRFSLLSQPLDRAALLAYFLGGIVPLVALVLFARRYASPALMELRLGGVILGLALLSLGSFLLLQRATRAALGRAARDNERLSQLVLSSGALGRAVDRDEVAEVATRCAAALTGSRAAHFLVLGKDGGSFSLLCSEGPAAAGSYRDHTEQIEELAALALPEEGRRTPDAVHGEIGGHPAAAVGVGANPDDSGAIVLYWTAPSPEGPVADRSLSALAGLVTVALKNCHLQALQKNFFTHVTNLLVGSLDIHLDYQTDHSRRVARLANQLGRAMGLPEKRLRDLHFASLLHDIGMLRIDRDSLREAGREAIEMHPDIGYQMLRQIELWRDVAPLVRHHHEWYDGDGYPDRLSGESIPLESRIIGVAEAFDSMTSQISYRSALPASEALQRIRDGAGSQFDPAVVAALVDLDLAP